MNRYQDTRIGKLGRYAAATIVTATLALSAPTAAAREITGVTVEWAPHYGSELDNGGALTVIVKEAFSRAGYQANVDFIPWPRALKNVEEGQNDFVMGAYFSEERAATYFVSDPIYSVDLGLMALKTLPITSVENLQSLAPYRIGVSRGYANTEEFDQADYLNKDIASSPKLNLRKLFRQRVDLVIGAFDIFRHQAKLEKLDAEQIHFVQPPLQSNALHLLASRKISDGEKLMADFNASLESMREDGTLDQLLKRYLNRS